MRAQFPQPGRMSDVARLAERAAREGRFGIDTEFMPEGRYRPLLCLVQVCVGGEIAVLDPFEGFDPAPFADVLADPGVQVVLHAGRQDVAIMRREWRCDVTNVFDTQVAAGFAGFPAQAGYTGLLHDVLKIRVAKTASFTRWDARPLTQEQLSYAKRGRRAPAAAGRRDPEAPALEGPARVGARGVPGDRGRRATSAIPQEVWRRLPRAGGLDPRERAVARELGAWRERTAMKEDRPVGSIIRDPTLVELAKRQPAGRRELGRSAASTRRWCAAAAPTCWRRSSAAARRRRSASKKPSACRRSPWTDQRSRSRRRWCVRGRRRPGSPTS